MLFNILIGSSLSYKLYSHEKSNNSHISHRVNGLIDKAVTKKPIIYIDEDTEENTKTYSLKFNQNNIFNDDIHSISDDFAKKLIDSAPAEVKDIVDSLIDPISRDLLPDRMLLLGEPGMGKTSLAMAIAKVTNRRYRLERAPDLLDKYKHSGSENINHLFHTLFKTKTDCVLILDEFTEITDLAEADNKQDKAAVAKFWTMLDDCNKYGNVFFIGTSNKAFQDLPSPIKTRFIDFDIITLGQSSYNSRKEAIRYHLAALSIPYKINDKYLDHIARRTSGKPLRMLDRLVKQAARNAKIRNKTDIVIQEQDFERLIKNWNTWNDWFGNLYQKIKPGMRIFITQGLPTVISILNLYLNQRNFYIQLRTQSNQFDTQLNLQQQSFNHQLEQSNIHNNLQIYSDEKLKDKVLAWQDNKALIKSDTKTINYLQDLKKEKI